MFQIFSRSQPIIPIFYVDAHVNQLNAENLLKKLRKSKYHHAKGIAVVCSVTNAMPVQVDKIYQEISRIRDKYKIPVYSFLTDECSAESYYVASCADHVYSLPSTVFNLHHNKSKLMWDDLLTQYNIKKLVIKSSNALNGNAFDQFTSANTAHLSNRKEGDVNKRIYSQAIKSRLARLKKQEDNKLYEEIKSKVPESIPNLMIGKDAIKAGLVDQIGEHYQILQEKFPGSRFEVVKYVNEPKMKWSLLIALLVIKGTIKWSLIMYLWLKSKENKKNQKENKNSE